ncbi:MAG: DUF4430 domain-containing protein [Oscillospiraceae bacterium]
MNSISRKITAVCIAMFCAVQTAFSAAAADFSRADECLGYFMEQRGAVSFWDGLEYGEADWAAYCRARLYGSDGAEEYARSAEEKVEQLEQSGGFVKPTDYQKAAVCIAAAGGDFRSAVEFGVFGNEQLDRQGFNAYIWGLIAVNVTGAEPSGVAVNTAETLAEHIISRQHEDGSFSLMGDTGDVDMTAAAVYALAGCGVSGAEQAAQRGADWLSAIGGGYSSMGITNCESTAQAVIALCAAGRSEKAYQAAEQLETFRRDGGYSHLADGDINGLATVQALEAYTALALMERGEMLFGEIRVSAPEQEEVLPQTFEAPQTAQPEMAQTAEAQAGTGITGTDIKIAISALAGTAAAVCLVMFVVRRKKVLAAAAVLLAACCGGAWLLDIKTPEEYYAQGGNGTMRAVVSADCSGVLGKIDSIDPAVNPPELIPQDGAVIPQCEVMLPDGASAFDALVAAARERRIRVDYTGSGFGTYVKGIGGIYELGFGSLSGWMYRVNGEFPEMSASDYVLQEGDVVEFLYTTDLGRDVGEHYSAETAG